MYDTWIVTAIGDTFISYIETNYIANIDIVDSSTAIFLYIEKPFI